jgi:hypothetical protein
MCIVMKNMFVHVFQGWASDVQPNIFELGMLDCHEDVLGVPSAQESQSELFRLLTGVSLHVLALETRCTTMPFLQAHVRIHSHSTNLREVRGLEGGQQPKCGGVTRGQAQDVVGCARSNFSRVEGT